MSSRGSFIDQIVRLAGVAGAFFLLAACSKSADTFEVYAPTATQATLDLCGRKSNLANSGGRFTETRRTSCEGDGRIAVIFAKLDPAECRIGYVTPGMGQNFRFEVVDGRCLAH